MARDAADRNSRGAGRNRVRAGASWCARAATSSSCRALVGDTAHGARRALRAARDEAVSARGLVLKLYEARKLS